MNLQNPRPGRLPSNAFHIGDCGLKLS
jgi:hypothetical protein